MYEFDVPFGAKSDLDIYPFPDDKLFSISSDI